MPYREPTAEELEDSRDARAARQQLERLEACTNHIEHARQLLADNSHPSDAGLEEAIAGLRAESVLLRARCSGQVESRHRPARTTSGDTCHIYVDECGQHLIQAQDPFPVFVLSAVIIRDEDEETVKKKWRKWKVDNLGYDAIVHEPDVRKHRRPFNGKRGELAIGKLPEIIEELPFMGVAIVLHRGDYMKQWGTGAVNSTLPSHPYMMATDMLMERIVLTLQSHFKSARAHIVAESRNAKEDAMLQYEFARLHLTGTSYISDYFFRELLHPGIRFLGKKENSTGLQLADLMARPLGDKIADLSSDPDRWKAFHGKLCDGRQTKNSILGMKVIPWDDEYGSLFKK